MASNNGQNTTSNTPPQHTADAALSETQPEGGTEPVETVEYEPPADGLRTTADGHQTLVTPADITRTPSAVRLGNEWVKTFWIGEYPDAPLDGFLEHLYAAAETRQTDISVHLDPRDTQATLETLENRIEDLQADYEYLSEKHRASARGVEKDLTDHEELYDILRNTPMEAFDVSMYLSVRGPDREEVAAGNIRTTASQAPANLTALAPRWSQLDALISCSPGGTDQLRETMETTTPMLGGAVGAMYPFVSGAFAEPGIEYGTYALNESPLILDRFKRETGYCAMVIGRLGAGKSFATKLRLLRRAMYDRETTIVMLDPMRGFAEISEALDGTHITIGGTRGLNPLELRPTPEHVLARADDIDPWGEQITWVMTFFETFFEEVANNPLGERSQTLRRATQAAYRRQGITRAPATHTNTSPTVRDVIGVLEAFADSPERFGYATTGEQTAVREDAESLLKDLRPSFRKDGALANLAHPTEFDLDSKIIYLDLHQKEGAQGRAQTSLMMQVLFNSVYEQVKQTDRKVVFVIDEAHYLLNDAASLGFLETAVRHSRHFDLSLEFVTQTGGEFALTPETRTIANLCSITVLHRINEEREKIARWFDLSDRQVDWVTTAKAGELEDGYSEALVGIDQKGWFPLRIRASEGESYVIDHASPGESAKNHAEDSPEGLDASAERAGDDG